jgi:ribonuclease Z
VESYRYEIAEAFANKHPEGTTDREGVILDAQDFTVEAIQLEHHGPCMGYCVREKPRSNIQPELLASLGLLPGPWMQALKSGTTESSTIEIDGKPFEIEKLRQELLVETQGDSIAYLTDFRLDEETADRLVPWLHGCQTVVCEAQYRHSDLELALRNHHMTTTLVSGLTARAGVEKLILFHLSNRYRPAEWQEMLAECRVNFPATTFPEHWNLES